MINTDYYINQNDANLLGDVQILGTGLVALDGIT